MPGPTHEPCKATLYKPKGALGQAVAGRNSKQGLPKNIHQRLFYVGETKLNVIEVFNRCALFTDKFLIDCIILIVSSLKK